MLVWIIAKELGLFEKAKRGYRGSRKFQIKLFLPASNRMPHRLWMVVSWMSSIAKIVGQYQTSPISSLTDHSFCLLERFFVLRAKMCSDTRVDFDPGESFGPRGDDDPESPDYYKINRFSTCLKQSWKFCDSKKPSFCDNFKSTESSKSI